LVYDPDLELWDFTYREINFIAFKPELTVPTPDQLDAISVDVRALEPEMRQRIAARWAKWGKGIPRTGEEYGVVLDDFAKDGTFGVSWSGDESWGDTGVVFQVRDRQIYAEDWAD